MNRVATALVVVVLVTFPYIDLEFSIPVGQHEVNLPVADAAALCLLALMVVQPKPAATFPASHRFYLLFLLLGGLSAFYASNSAVALHDWLRKPVFSGLAYGLALAGTVSLLPSTETLRRALLAGCALVATISLATSVQRIVGGDALWFGAIAGLTNNHKTLAVALAPALVLCWGWQRDNATRMVVGLGVAALALSVSRTAWIAAAVGSCWFIVWGGKTLAARRGLVFAVLIAGVLGATYSPLLTQSFAQLDALRSRHSLDLRAWRLFTENPILGAGAGASVRDEAQTFPHYRVNGVEAHGVIQKVASEHGLVGLLAYGAFVASAAQAVRRRHRDGCGVWPAFVALHANLLLSTETFTQTHWAMFGLLTGLVARPSEPR